ncbi:MAG: hypothetical protein KAS94_12515, partial [Desulfobulbaceae bacterium]|nr:hypothetical protein [Desulfobulbaceae bacterium]
MVSSLGGTIHRDEFLWVLGSLSGLYRFPFDAELVAQSFPPPCDRTVLHEAARSLGLKTGTCNGAELDWRKLPLPTIAFLAPEEQVQDDLEPDAESDPAITASDGDPTEPEDTPVIHPVIILKSEGDKFLYFRAGSQSPESVSIEEAPSLFEPELIMVGREFAPEEGEEDIPGFETEKKKFGFSWFIPELLKHKPIWRDVLLASLAIQLVGLTTPLFTQVIIDKVIAHQTQSTLIVIGVALIMFMLFNMTMTWLRQYLVLHTGNRIDSVLGSKVFRHLLRLPLPYFENRPTGTLVARMQGIETIRQFVTGAAVTLILDLPFLLIFLAVMFLYSWQLSLIAVGLLALITLVSALATPVLREKINQQFMLGAQNQAFLTEYLSGMDTVKSLQMEPDVDRKYEDIFTKYLAAGFSTRQVSNTYNV